MKKKISVLIMVLAMCMSILPCYTAYAGTMEEDAVEYYIGEEKSGEANYDYLYYYFNLDSDSVLELDCEVDNSHIKIYDSIGKELLDSDNMVFDYNAARETNSGKTYISLRQGKYYIRISGSYTYYRFSLNYHDHTYSNVVTKATMYSNGRIVNKCVDCGKTIKTTTIPRIAKVALSSSRYVYDGRQKNPSLIVRDISGKTISSAYYTLTKTVGRSNVGKYFYKIVFKGRYSGTYRLAFLINPKGTSLSKVKAIKRGLNVSWKKQASQTSGYQVQVSKTKSFAGAKTLTLKNNKSSCKVSGLTAKKRYYVRIRTYKASASAKCYSSWSAVKYATTKR